MSQPMGVNVRLHGWQLPLNNKQVSAIAAFIWLVVAFFIFYVPFIGSNVVNYVAIGVYAPVALVVLLLYIRCSSIDPSDSRIFCSDKIKGGDIERALLNRSSLLSAQVRAEKTTIMLEAQPSRILVKNDRPRENGDTRMESGFCTACRKCGWIVKNDDCKNETASESFSEEDILICNTCNIETDKFTTKHCNACNKCVDKFDHHCEWMNNCVGKKNYSTFFVLVTFSVILFILQGGFGIKILVRCFLDKKGIDKCVLENLGEKFPTILYIIIVVLCTVFSAIVLASLGELIVFHIILISKGMTTYEYFLAMRAQVEPHPSISYEGNQTSTISYGTPLAITEASSPTPSIFRIQNPWCTPPRMLVVDEEDEDTYHLEPNQPASTSDPEAPEIKPQYKANKGRVSLNIWDLAKLNPDEAKKVAKQARKNSTITRALVAGTPKSQRSFSEKSDIQNNVPNYAIRRHEAKEKGKASALRPAYARSKSTMDRPEAVMRRVYTNSSSEFQSTAIPPLHMEKRFNSSIRSELSGSTSEVQKHTENRYSIGDDESASEMQSHSSPGINDVPATGSSMSLHNNRLFHTEKSILYGGPQSIQIISDSEKDGLKRKIFQQS